MMMLLIAEKQLRVASCAQWRRLHPMPSSRAPKSHDALSPYYYPSTQSTRGQFRLKQGAVLAITLFAVLLQTQPSAAQSETDHGESWIAFNRAGAPHEGPECFLPSNVTVGGGKLVLITKVERSACSSFDLPPTTYKYTSGFVAMRTFHFLYGTVEFRARFGGGARSGAWPAVWMADVSCQASDPNGTNGQCNGQEIDIAEIMHGDFTHVNQQIHVNHFARNDGCSVAASDTSKDFHVYQLIWSQGSLVFKIDGSTTCVIKRNYVPTAPMYLKADVCAGEMGGPIKDETLPWETLIDYVRVTQQGTVVFDDEFNGRSTIDPGQPGHYDPRIPEKPPQRSSAYRRLLWLIAPPSVCAVLIGAVLIHRQARA